MSDFKITSVDIQNCIDALRDKKIATYQDKKLTLSLHQYYCEELWNEKLKELTKDNKSLGFRLFLDWLKEDLEKKEQKETGRAKAVPSSLFETINKIAEVAEKKIEDNLT